MRLKREFLDKKHNKGYTVTKCTKNTRATINIGIFLRSSAKKSKISEGFSTLVFLPNKAKDPKIPIEP